MNIHSTKNVSAIMLSRIRTPPSEIKKAILLMDDRVLSVDDLKAIERYTPTDDEVNRAFPSYFCGPISDHYA